jgi:hypothetical protein
MLYYINKYRKITRQGTYWFIYVTSLLAEINLYKFYIASSPRLFFVSLLIIHLPIMFFILLQSKSPLALSVTNPSLNQAPHCLGKYWRREWISCPILWVCLRSFQVLVANPFFKTATSAMSSPKNSFMMLLERLMVASSRARCCWISLIP